MNGFNADAVLEARNLGSNQLEAFSQTGINLGGRLLPH
jgi:hypothetical protein